MGDVKRWWWPAVYPGHLSSYWPRNAFPQESLHAFVSMYVQHGFETCEHGELEPGFVKVALFVEGKEGLPAHASLQLPAGKWISKMWDQEDIMHTLEGLTGPPHYFTVARFMRCPVTALSPAQRELLARYPTP